ncbi:MAG: dihydrolipoyl dehydrogenase [Anaerovoracaceae bacterium]|jgi:dihydrolipoamide dehydrogenase
MEKYDLIIIGAGPGGYESAAEASSRYGMKTALIESRDLGGTCLNRGCIPTKTLLHTASMYYSVHTHGSEIGLTGGDGLGYDMKKLNERKNDVVQTLRDGVAQSMKKSKVTVYSGLGSILAPGKVRVRLNDGGEEILETEHILIATGSVPAIPPIKGADNPGVLTSDEILDLSEPIESLVVVGGGVIGMEFASVFSSLGVKVTIVEALDRIIANLDREFSQSLKMIAKKSKGIDIHTKATVTEISGNGGPGTNGMICTYEEKGETCQASGDYILMSVGRRAYTEGLFDDEATDDVKNMALDRGKITVNDKYETSVPGIYAIGDVIGGIQLAHVATAEGRTAVANMCGKDSGIDMKNVPSCIYTSPEIASVGITQQDAKDQGIDVVTKKYPMGANGKSVLSQQERGFIKVVADKETGVVLGAQMMCARATDMITQFSQAITNKLTLDNMAAVIYPHPTFVEGIGEDVR